MISIHKLKVNQTIVAIKYGKSVKGIIISKLPGAVVIINSKSGDNEVVDVDRITKILKDENN